MDFIYICVVVIILLISTINSHVAEWLGRGLQNLLQRFEPVHDVSLFKLTKAQCIIGLFVF